MAYYSKYRPQKISDLDLETVRQSLGEILAAKDVPHAFLFVGPKGTGKTSAARIVARAVNCTAKKKSGEPCNRCETCKLIGENRSLDLIEIDAASNRGIDDIRELRDKINLVPAQAKFKVYIIDEVHMLTREAFNALLKTLEEPPAHAKFVLCTTEPQKLPGTVVSRCWRLSFNKATVEELVKALKKAVKGEKLKIKLKDLKLVAQKSDGSFRDGVKVLEQLAMAGNNISSKRVKEMLKRGLVERSLDEWLVMVYQAKTNEALIWLAKAVEEGLNVRQFMVEVVERLRQVMLDLLGVEKQSGLKEIDDLESLKDLIELMMKASQEVKVAVVESLPIELVIVEWSNQGRGRSSQIIEDEIKEKIEPKEKAEPAVKISSQSAIKLTSKSGKLTIKEVMAKWRDVLEAMRPHNHSLEALLRATRPKGFDGKLLAVEVFYKFHKERLEMERYKSLVEEIASKVLVAPIKVKYYLGQKAKKIVKEKQLDDNISAEVDEDIIKTAEEVFGVKVD